MHSFTPRLTGLYSLVMSGPDGGAVPPTSYTVDVASAAPCAGNGTLLAAPFKCGAATGCVAGVACCFTINMTDVLGNPFTLGTTLGVKATLTTAAAGAVTSAAILTGVSGAKSGESFYHCSFVPTAAGTYSVAVSELRASQYVAYVGLQATRAPPVVRSFSVSVAAGGVSAPSCFAYGDGLYNARGDAPATFTVVMADVAGNALGTISTMPAVTFSVSTRSTPIVALLNGNGTRWVVSYIPTSTASSAIITIKTAANVAIPGSPFRVVIAPAAPPVLLAVRLLPSGAGALLTFDGPTYPLGIGQSTDCSLLFAAATVTRLGSGAICYWAPPTDGALGPTQLVALFGSGATAVPRGSPNGSPYLALASGAILNAYGGSAGAAGSAVLLPPDSDAALLTPVISMTAAPAVGACEPIVLDASGSSGGGTGGGLSFEWALVSGLQKLDNGTYALDCSAAPLKCPRYATLASRVAAAASPILVIGRGEADANVLYTFRVTVGNYALMGLGGGNITSATATYVVEKLGAATPVVQVGALLLPSLADMHLLSSALSALAAHSLTDSGRPINPPLFLPCISSPSPQLIGLQRLTAPSGFYAYDGLALGQDAPVTLAANASAAGSYAYAASTGCTPVANYRPQVRSGRPHLNLGTIYIFSVDMFSTRTRPPRGARWWPIIGLG